jgi:hypothetical protein
VMFPAFNERFMKDHPELAAKYDQSLLIQFFKIFSEGGP